MVGVEGVSKVWLRGSWLQLEFDTHRSYLPNSLYAAGPHKHSLFSISLHRFAALARRQLVPGSVRLWGRVEVRLLIICFLLIVWSRILGDASLFSNFTGFTGGLNLKLRFPLRKAGCSVRGTFPPSFPIPGWLTSSTG